jgi:hypothetical protein
MCGKRSSLLYYRNNRCNRCLVVPQTYEQLSDCLEALQALLTWQMHFLNPAYTPGERRNDIPLYLYRN